MAHGQAPQLTGYPPVNQEYREIVKYLRDQDGCLFQPHKGKVKVVRGGRVLAHLPMRGKANDVRAIHRNVAELRAKGLLAGYDTGATTGKVGQALQAAVAGAASKPGSPPPVYSPPPVRAVPDLAPAPAAAVSTATANEEEVAAVADSDPARLARPVRPHTAHQYRVDDIRRRVLRCLQELGGNTAEVRGEFVRLALAEGAARGLPLPQPGVLGGESSAYESLRQSLRSFLNGKGQGQRNLDLYEAAVQALEAPKPKQVAVPLAAAAAAGTTGAKVVQANDSDGRITHEVQAYPVVADPPSVADPPLRGSSVRLGGGSPAVALPLVGGLPGGRSGRAGVGVEPVASEPPPPPAVPPVRNAGLGWHEYGASDGPALQVGATGEAVPVAAATEAIKLQYLDDLRAKAAEGDNDARDRLERYLGLA